MGGYLPQVFERFGSDYPAVMEAFRELAERLHEAGPLSARERRLAKLGIAIGSESEGGVRSHARKALAEGIEREAIRHVALLGITTGGLPSRDGCHGLDQRGPGSRGIGQPQPEVRPDVTWALERARNPRVIHVHTTVELTRATIETCPPASPPERLSSVLAVGVRSVDLHRYRARLNLNPGCAAEAAWDGVARAIEAAWGPPAPLPGEPSPRGFKVAYRGPR